MIETDTIYSKTQHMVYKFSLILQISVHAWYSQSIATDMYQGFWPHEKVASSQMLLTDFVV